MAIQGQTRSGLSEQSTHEKRVAAGRKGAEVRKQNMQAQSGSGDLTTGGTQHWMGGQNLNFGTLTQELSVAEKQAQRIGQVLTRFYTDLASAQQGGQTTGYSSGGSTTGKTRGRKPGSKNKTTLQSSGGTQTVA